MRKRAGNNALKVFRKGSRPTIAGLIGGWTMAITLYERIGDIAFTMAVFATKTYVALAFI